MEDLTTLCLVLALCLQTFNVGRLTRRVRLLEQAMKHLTPDHRLDALEKTVAALGAGTLKSFETVNKALLAFANTDQSLLAAIVKVKQEAEETYFRKDHVQ